MADVDMLNMHRNDVVSMVLSVSEARIAEAMKALDEISWLFEHGEDIADDHNSFSRVKLADSGLALDQVIVPALKRLGERLLEVAGKKAVRHVCSGHHVNGNHIPSRYTVPPEYETVVGKVKAALTT